jgi:hypothetical protein
VALEQDWNGRWVSEETSSKTLVAALRALASHHGMTR